MSGGPDGDVLMRARVESHLTEFLTYSGHVSEEFFGGQQRQDALKDLYGKIENVLFAVRCRVYDIARCDTVELDLLLGPRWEHLLGERFIFGWSRYSIKITFNYLDRSFNHHSITASLFTWHTCRLICLPWYLPSNIRKEIMAIWIGL